MISVLTRFVKQSARIQCIIFVLNSVCSSTVSPRCWSFLFPIDWHKQQSIVFGLFFPSSHSLSVFFSVVVVVLNYIYTYVFLHKYGNNNTDECCVLNVSCFCLLYDCDCRKCAHVNVLPILVIGFNTQHMLIA